MAMKLIEWRDEFRIGLPGVDAEHQALIAQINALHRDLAAGAAPARVADALGSIVAAITAHFALEEKDMSALGYDGFAGHKAQHEQLLDEISGIVDEVVEGGRYDPGALSARLADWFVGHFRTEDARLHRWMGERGRPADQLLS